MGHSGVNCETEANAYAEKWASDALTRLDRAERRREEEPASRRDEIEEILREA